MFSAVCHGVGVNADQVISSHPQELRLFFRSCFPYARKIPPDQEFLKSTDRDRSDTDVLSARHKKSLMRDKEFSAYYSARARYTRRKIKQSLLNTNLLLPSGQDKTQRTALPYIVQKTHIHLDKDISAG